MLIFRLHSLGTWQCCHRTHFLIFGCGIDDIAGNMLDPLRTQGQRRHTHSPAFEPRNQQNQVRTASYLHGAERLAMALLARQKVFCARLYDTSCDIASKMTTAVNYSGDGPWYKITWPFVTCELRRKKCQVCIVLCNA